MIGLILTLCLSNKAPFTRDIDGEEAMKIAESFVRKMNVRTKLELQSLGQIEGPTWGFGPGKFKTVDYKGADGRRVQFYITAGGAVQVFDQTLSTPAPQNNKPYHIVNGMPEGWIDPEPMANKLIRLTGAKGPFRYRNQWLLNMGPTYNVFYDLIVSNHRFFNMNPTYGYALTFNQKTSEVYDFRSPPPLPPVDATVAVIDKAKADATLLHWAKTHYRTGGGSVSMYSPDWRGKVELRTELGYFKFRNEPKARLVWEGRTWSQFTDKAPWVDDGAIGVLMDAVTGELIKPDDPALS